MSFEKEIFEKKEREVPRRLSLEELKQILNFNTEDLEEVNVDSQAHDTTKMIIDKKWVEAVGQAKNSERSWGKFQLEHGNEVYADFATMALEGLFTDFNHLKYLDTSKWPEDLEVSVDERINILKQFLKGKVLVDIGTGVNLSAYTIARLAECKAYVAVEAYHSEALAYNLQHKDNPSFSRWIDKDAEEVIKKSPLIPFAVIKAEALTFLKRIPDKSVCVSAFGMDQDIFHEFSKFRAIEAEMGRVLADDGAFLGFTSGDELRPTGVKPAYNFNKLAIKKKGERVFDD